MYKLQIKITKEILKQSMYCGQPEQGFITQNCAIAKAVKDIFPLASVSYKWNDKSECVKAYMSPAYNQLEEIFLPDDAKIYMQDFDKLESTPDKRLDLPEFSFEIEIPDSIISKINIEDAFKKLEGHENLKLIEA